MSDCGLERSEEDHDAGQLEGGISVLIRLVKEQNRLLQQLQTSLNGPKISPSPESVDEPGAPILGEPESKKFGSLGSFLLLYLHEDGPTDISARRGKVFLERAKSTFNRIVSELQIIRAHRPGSHGYSLDSRVLEALKKQVSNWPEGLSAVDNLGLSRAFSEDSKVYVHGSLNGGNHVSLGSVWTVRTASLSSEDPSLSPVVVTAIALILESCKASFDAELRGFLLHYLGDQETPLSVRVTSGASEGGTLWMPFHLRCFGKLQNLGKRSENPNPKIVCRRYKAIDLGIRERRRSIVLLCPFARAKTEPESTGNYVILRLLDDGWHDFRYEDNLPICSLQLCQPWTGITIFQHLLWGEIDWWVDSWRGVLETIDNLVAFEISDVLDSESREKLMYDDHKLNRSETYFTVEQLLRIFEEWTSDPEEDIRTLLHQTAYEMKSRIQSREPEVQRIIDRNWKLLLSHAQNSRNEIVGLIERKRNEIQSLRDGLYNTMQVREATRGTKMNEIMLLFTIATIVYLPPTFVATFTALDLFQITDKTQFWSIFATTSVVTYVLAAVGLLSIYRKDLVDWLRTRIAVRFQTHDAPPGLGKTTFLEREKKQRHKENLGRMQRARSRRTPLRRSTFRDSTAAVTNTGESLAGPHQNPVKSRQSQATVISQALWRSEDELSPPDLQRPRASSLFSRGSTASPASQATGPSRTSGGPRIEAYSPARFTARLPVELRNL